MRYWKGSIALSPTRDYPLLRRGAAIRVHHAQPIIRILETGLLCVIAQSLQQPRAPAGEAWPAHPARTACSSIVKLSTRSRKPAALALEGKAERLADSSAKGGSTKHGETAASFPRFERDPPGAEAHAEHWSTGCQRPRSGREMTSPPWLLEVLRRGCGGSSRRAGLQVRVGI